MKEKWKIKIILIMAFLCLPCLLFFGGCSCSSEEEDNGVPPGTKYSVSFYTDSGDTFDYTVLHVEAGSIITEPKRPVKLGYSFVAWYREDLVTKWAFESDRVNSDIKLYAKWQLIKDNSGVDIPDTEKVRISYYLEPTSTQPYETREIDKGTKTAQPITPTKYGYEFVYWCTDSTLSEKFDFNNEINENIQLYAKWKEPTCPEGTHSHKVYFYLNGSLAGYEHFVEVNHGGYIDRIVADSVANKYSEKEIDGWYTDDTRTTRWRFNYDQVTKDLKLFAKYEDK